MTRTVAGRLPNAMPPVVKGRLLIPASKSHTIRALLIAAYAGGESRLRQPLMSLDTSSCRRAIETLGAKVKSGAEDWVVSGLGGMACPAGGIDVGNSGTTLYLTTALAALGSVPVRFDGDKQTRRRSAAPLLTALRHLGAQVASTRGGYAPFTVTGPLKTGRVELECQVSQYLSALLLAVPLIGENEENRTVITVKSLNEAPYVGITLSWLESQGIRYEREGWREFSIPAGQHYKAFDRAIPADWSSAAFFLVAAAITGGTLLLEGLDVNDSQGDKEILDMLERMGCLTESLPNAVRIRGRPLTAAVLDLNDMPDALPAMAVAGCFAEGITKLVNVPQARMKESDRIAVMCAELHKLGFDARELPDGMIIHGKRPRPGSGRDCDGAMLDGHQDHRVVMALAVAALGCRGRVSIRGAEAADITFPGFFELLEKHSYAEREIV